MRIFKSDIRISPRTVIDQNLIFSILSIAVRSLSALFMVIAISRTLGVSGFANFTYALVAAGLIVLIIDFGFELKLTRDGVLALPRISEITLQMALVKLIMLFPASFLFWILYVTKALDQEILILLILMLFAQTLYSFTKHFIVPLRASALYGRELMITVFVESLVLVSCVGAAIVYRDPSSAAAGFMLGRFLGFLLSLAAFQSWFGFHKVKCRVLAELKLALPFAVHTGLATLYFTIDVLIIRHFVSEFDLGIYQAGIRALMAACLLTLVVQNLFLPRLAESTISRAAFNERSRRYAVATFLSGFAIAILVTLLREPLIRIVFGSEFLELSPLVPYFAIIVALRYVGSLYGAYLTIVPSGQRVRAYAALISLIIVVAGNLYFAPEYGIWGALSVLLAAHVTITGIYIGYWHLFGKRQLFI